MPDSVSLIKDNPLLPAEDFTAMRRQGISAIERLSSNIWTDYNTSDPGITILEAVCYAITDLSYRTDFDIKDILAGGEQSDHPWKQVFYTARQILHNSALTITDYRKIIIDVAGVRNAWIVPSKDYEVPIWIDYKNVETRPDNTCSCDDSGDKLCIGKLSLYPWDEASGNDNNAALIRELQAKLAAGQKKAEQQKADIAKITDPKAKDEAQKALAALEAELAKIAEQIKKLQSIPVTILPSKIVELEGLYNVMVEYEEDILEEGHREDVRQQVIERLQGHRNLCEDFLSINAVEYEDFGIGASIELEEAADPDIVLAQIFFVIYKYFTPSVPFYTINQLMAKGYSVDDIFEGPALKHGFMLSEDVEATDLFRDIRLSDIISEVADIPGVKAILYLHLPFAGFKDDSAGKNFFNEWVDFLTEERKIARIQPAMSSIMFCKARDFITYNVNPDTDRKPDRMQKMFYDLKVTERKYKLTGAPLDFPVPEGEDMEIQDYYPITYSLPDCYGVNDRAGLPPDASDTRKVQALQLKGYLLFFEQILSDYLVQLDHLRDLFTFDDTIKTAQYSRVLTELDGLKDLLADHAHYGNNYNQIVAGFKEVLENLSETPKQFLRRRSRFLDHMLARYSEDMSEYTAIMRGLFPYKVEERLVKDKIRVLKNGEYFQISTDRAQGYNYAQLQYWDTLNVSGTERRVGRLLGFPRVDRHTLVPENIVIEPWVPPAPDGPVPPKKDGDIKYNTIRLVDPNNKEHTLLTSVRVKDGCCTEELLTSILEHADDRKYFVFHDERKQQSRKTAGLIGNFWFELFDDTNPAIAVLLGASEKYKSRDERDKAFHLLLALMKVIDDNEGMHMVEHILLRPKMDKVLDENNNPIDVALLDICLDDCDLNKGLNEGTDIPPYRKKISRIPAEKCYDQMPWILEYFRLKPFSNKDTSLSVLYAQTFSNGDAPISLKFRKYEALTRCVRDLQEFGTERVNYEIVRNEEDAPEAVKYSFIIHGKNYEVLAQSPFIFNRQTKEQREKNIAVPDDIEVEIGNLMQYFGFELDLYCDEDPCDHNEDPYSFRTTAVLPCWPKRFRDPTFRHLVEKTILSESPAHVHIRVIWIGFAEMRRFEKAYSEWLLEMAQTEAPVYDKVNPLVQVLNTLKACGHCDDDCAEPVDKGRKQVVKDETAKA